MRRLLPASSRIRGGRHQHVGERQGHLAFRNAPISGLIPYLSTEVGHIVMDKTWLAGSYDSILDFVTDRHGAGLARLRDLRSSMH